MILPLYRWSALLLILFLLINTLTPLPGAAAASWQNKVDPALFRAFEKGSASQAGYLVYLKEQVDLSGAQALQTKREKGDFVFHALTERARRSQAPLLRDLQRRGVSFRSYWIANMVWVQGDLPLVQVLAERSDVAHIYANPAVRADTGESQSALHKTAAIEWNIEKIGAPLVWAEGYTGEGVVVGGQDTGYDWQHPALLRQYRGWDGNQADHSYSWHDAIREDIPQSLGENVCGFDSPVPCDDNGHGTHTMGTVLGDDGAGTQIGVAPGARWIGCRNMENGWGTPASYAECYEWFVAPYPQGSTPLEGNPGMAPDIINNSWACPPEEGCTEPDILLAVVDNVRAAGILTVHSAGNSGAAGCSTVNEVAAIYDSSFTVGNLTSSDVIALSSSRGPVIVDGSGRPKPDITAPGTLIFSSYLAGGYRISSGTSMAAPHVAGVAALLLSAQPALSGQVSLLEEVITQTAFPLTSGEDCGGVDGGSIPNNTYGYGRVDAWEALNHLPHGFDLSVSVPPGWVMPGESIRYTVLLTHYHPHEDAQEVLLAAHLPDGLIVEASSHAYIQVGEDLLWTFASMAPQESILLQLDVRVDDSFQMGTPIQALFSVTSQQVEIPVFSQPSYVFVGRVVYLPAVR